MFTKPGATARPRASNRGLADAEGRDLGDGVAVEADVADKGRGAAAVVDGAAADDDVVHRARRRRRRRGAHDRRRRRGCVRRRARSPSARDACSSRAPARGLDARALDPLRRFGQPRLVRAQRQPHVAFAGGAEAGRRRRHHARVEQARRELRSTTAPWGKRRARRRWPCGTSTSKPARCKPAAQDLAPLAIDARASSRPAPATTTAPRRPPPAPPRTRPSRCWS